MREAAGAAAQHRRADSRRAQHGLGDSGDPDARQGEPVNQDPRVLLDLVEIGLDPKRHTVVVVSATAASAGKAISTMSTRSDEGRVSGSVTGRPSCE